MADGIYYGDPGGTPDPHEMQPRRQPIRTDAPVMYNTLGAGNENRLWNWLRGISWDDPTNVNRYRQGDMSVTPTGSPWSGASLIGDTNILQEPGGYEQSPYLESLPQTSQSGYFPPGVGYTGGLDPGAQSNRYGLAPTQHQGVVPAFRYITRDQGRGIGYQPPGDTPEGGGDGSRFEFTYDNIRDLERGLKEAGYTGQTIYKDGDVIRRDGQGRILSITRGASGGGKRIGWSPPNQRNKSRRGGNAVGTDWDRQGRSSSKYVDRNKFARPDWIKTMSNWRGI